MDPTCSPTSGPARKPARQADGFSRRDAVKMIALGGAALWAVPGRALAGAADAPADFALSGKRLFHGAAYYPELWPESAIDRDIELMKELGINVVRMGEFAWSTLEPDEGHISLDFFTRVMDRLHAAGIGTVFCTPTATPPVWLTHGHPERCFVNQDGEVMVHGARQHVSYDHPAVQAVCWRIVKAIARALGRHPGLVAWQIDNELKCHVAEDYSAASEKGWHEWLKKRYGTIDRLNEAWGTEIWSERYQSFSQVPPSRKTPFLHNASLMSAYLQFSRDAIAEFQDTQCEIIRRYSRAPITHNMNPGFAVSQERMCRNLDFASFDAYPAHTNHTAIPLYCDLFRDAKPGRRFWLMETSSSHNGWLGNNENPVHPTGFLVVQAVATYGLGGEAFCYWLWRQQRTGCELPHSAILSAWGKPAIGFESVKAVDAARRKIEPLLLETTPLTPEVALTWSDRGRVFLQTEALGASSKFKVDFRASITEWHRLLLDLGYNRHIRFEDAALDGLKLLITPSMPAVSEAFLKRVRAWVEQGGVWICGPLTGTRTLEHTVPTDAGLGALEVFAGVETVFSFPVTGSNAGGEAFGIKAPLAGWCSALRPRDAGTRVLGTFKCDASDGLAFLTARKVGRGEVVMLTAQPQESAGRVLLEKLVTEFAEKAGVRQRYAVSPGTLVCPRLSRDGRVLWVVVNMDGKGGSLVLSRPARDALGSGEIPSGRLELGGYEYRLLWT